MQKLKQTMRPELWLLVSPNARTCCVAASRTFAGSTVGIRNRVQIWNQKPHVNPKIVNRIHPTAKFGVPS